MSRFAAQPPPPAGVVGSSPASLPRPADERLVQRPTPTRTESCPELRTRKGVEAAPRVRSQGAWRNASRDEVCKTLEELDDIVPRGLSYPAVRRVATEHLHKLDERWRAEAVDRFTCQKHRDISRLLHVDGILFHPKPERYLPPQSATSSRIEAAEPSPAERVAQLCSILDAWPSRMGYLPLGKRRRVLELVSDLSTEERRTLSARFEAQSRGGQPLEAVLRRKLRATPQIRALALAALLLPVRTRVGREAGEEGPLAVAGLSPEQRAVRLWQILDSWPVRLGVLTYARQREVLDIVHGLHPDDRQAMAEHFATLSGGRQDLLGALRGLLRFSPRSQAAAVAYLRNASGELEAHDKLWLMLQPWWRGGSEPQAALRLLTQLGPAQLDLVDKALRRDYRICLDDLIGRGLSGTRRRLAEFAANTTMPRDEANRPAWSYVRAHDLHQALSKLRPQLAAVFRIIEELDTAENGVEGTELKQVVDAYADLYGAKLFDSIHRAAGGLTSRLLERSSASLWRKRLQFAREGLRGNPNVTQSARYAAVTLQQALRGRRWSVHEEDLTAALTRFVRPPDGGPDTAAMPTLKQVSGAYFAMFGRNLEADVYSKFAIKPELDGEALEDAVWKRRSQALWVAHDVFNGRSVKPSRAVAMALAAAPLTAWWDPTRRPDPSVFALLDRPYLPAQEREAFCTEVGREFESLMGVRLRDYIVDNFGARDKRLRKPRPLVLLEKGTLSRAERLYYDIFEARSWLFFQRVRAESVVDTLKGLSDAERLSTLAAYAKLRREPLGVEDGRLPPKSNPLLRDLSSLRRAQYTQIANLLEVMPISGPFFKTDVDRIIRDGEEGSRELQDWLLRELRAEGGDYPARDLAGRLVTTSSEVGRRIAGQLELQRSWFLPRWLWGAFGSHTALADDLQRRSVSILSRAKRVARATSTPQTTDRTQRALASLLEQTYVELQQVFEEQNGLKRSITQTLSAGIGLAGATTVAFLLPPSTAATAVIASPLIVGAAMSLLSSAALMGNMYDVSLFGMLQDLGRGAMGGHVALRGPALVIHMLRQRAISTVLRHGVLPWFGPAKDHLSGTSTRDADKAIYGRSGLSLDDNELYAAYDGQTMPGRYALPSNRSFQDEPLWDAGSTRRLPRPGTPLGS